MAFDTAKALGALKGMLVVILMAFGFGVAWGACQVGVTLVKRMAE